MVAWMKSPGQPMHKYVDKWDLYSAQLASIYIPMEEWLPLTIIPKFFGDCSRSR